MTAPAEDPRDGEAWRPVCGCEQGMGHMDRGCHSYGLCHVQSAERAACPAGDRAQPTQELREAIKDTLFQYGIRGERLGSLRPGAVADALIAGPLAALLDAQAAVNRVEAVMAAWNRGEPVGGYLPTLLRRALDGTT